MKTLVIYDSKYGYTEKCVQTLSSDLSGEVDVKKIRKDSKLDLKNYQKVIIGGSIYMGKIQKSITDFCVQNLDALTNKKIGLFICCMFADDKALEQLEGAFPKEIFEIASIKDNFGGEVNLNRMSFVDKLATKMISKATEKSEDGPLIIKNCEQIEVVDNGRISRFADIINHL